MEVCVIIEYFHNCSDVLFFGCVLNLSTRYLDIYQVDGFPLREKNKHLVTLSLSHNTRVYFSPCKPSGNARKI